MTNNFLKSDVCSEISEDLSAFIDGELPKEQLAKIYEHLLECNNCRQNYEDLKITRKTLQNYFKRSTEEFIIPEKPYENSTKDNIINKIIFIKRQRKVIYTAAALMFLAIVSYFSINFINFNPAEKNALHKVKFTKNESVLTPLQAEPNDFTKEFKKQSP